MTRKILSSSILIVLLGFTINIKTMDYGSDDEQEPKVHGEMAVTFKNFTANICSYARNHLGDGYLSHIMDQNPTPAAVKVFFENNANPNPPDEIPLLHKAKTPEMIQLLVSYKANINAQIGECGINALYPECDLISLYTDEQQYALAKKLIACKANPNHRDCSGTTPLQYCVSMYCVGYVKALLEAGADTHGVEQAIFIDPTSLSCAPDIIPDKVITIVEELANAKVNLKKLKKEVSKRKKHKQFRAFYGKLLTVLDK